MSTTRNTIVSNLFPEDWAALKNLSKRNDIVVKLADKGGAVVVWRSDVYQKEALRRLSDTSFYAKVQKDLTSTNQNILKDTIQSIMVNQELPNIATNISREEVDQFITSVNSFHPALKYIWEISETSLAFLDIKVSISGNVLCTIVHYKT